MTKGKINIDDLWVEFKSDNETLTKHKIINHYTWLVRYVIQQMSIPKNNLLDDEDFVNIGIIGLNEAIERFDPERGVKFESFATPRIRGTIQDELRRLDWLSRTARKKATDYLDAIDNLRSEFGREATSEEVREHLNVTPDQYDSYLKASAAAKASLSMSDISKISPGGEENDFDTIEDIADTDTDNILTKLENEERVRFIADFLNSLVEKKRLVMTLYYYEELTFKEIGKVLNVSESRVCQIHTQVVNNLKVELTEFDNA